MNNIEISEETFLNILSVSLINGVDVWENVHAIIEDGLTHWRKQYVGLPDGNPDRYCCNCPNLDWQPREVNGFVVHSVGCPMWQTPTDWPKPD